MGDTDISRANPVTKDSIFPIFSLSKLFASTCVACHGANGQGNPMLGAPNLTHADAFIYGASFAQLQQTIRYGRQGVMPAQAQLQGNDRVHLLAAYVYSLSHGEGSPEVK